mgnify:FL=1
MSKQNASFEYNIRKFSTDNMDKTRSCIFIGGSGTGKSHAVTSILYHNRDIPAGIVMSGTEEGDPYWARHVPDLFIYNGWEPQKLEEMIDIQKRKKKGLEQIEINIEYCKKK